MMHWKQIPEQPYFADLVIWYTRLKRKFTPRQLEIFYFLERGLSNAEVAAQIGISEKCVKYHLTLAFAKAGVQNRGKYVHHIRTKLNEQSSSTHGQGG